MQKRFRKIILLIFIFGLIFFSFKLYFLEYNSKKNEKSKIVDSKSPLHSTATENEIIINNLEKFREALLNDNDIQNFLEFPIETNRVDIWSYSRDIYSDSSDSGLLEKDYELNKDKIFSDVFRKLLKKINFKNLKENDNTEAVLQHSDGNTYSMTVKIQSLSNGDLVDGICFEIISNIDYSKDDKFYDSIFKSNKESIHKYFWITQHLFRKDMKNNIKLSYINIF